MTASAQVNPYLEQAQHLLERASPAMKREISELRRTAATHFCDARAQIEAILALMVQPEFDGMELIRLIERQDAAIEMAKASIWAIGEVVKCEGES